MNAQTTVSVTPISFSYNAVTQVIPQSDYSSIYLLSQNMNTLALGTNDFSIDFNGTVHDYSSLATYENPSYDLDVNFMGEHVSTSGSNFFSYAEKNGTGFGDLKILSSDYTVISKGGLSYLLEVVNQDHGCGSDEPSNTLPPDAVDPTNCWDISACSVTILPLYTEDGIPFPFKFPVSDRQWFMDVHSMSNFNTFITALKRSNIDLQAEMIRADATTFVESSNHELDVHENIPDNVDINNKRSATGADLVIVFTGDYSGINGRAQGINDDVQEQYYNAVVETASTPNWTFSHEVGHLLSARHQAGVDLQATFAHAHFVSSSEFTMNGTNITGPNNTFTNFAKILNYSNPNVSYMGVATGIEQGPNYNNPSTNHNNACAINGRQCRIATFNSPIGLIEADMESPDDEIMCRVNSSGRICLDITTTGSDPGMDWYRVTIRDASGNLIGSPQVRGNLGGTTSDQFCTLIDQSYMYQWLSFSLSVTGTSGAMSTGDFEFFYCICDSGNPEDDVFCDTGRSKNVIEPDFVLSDRLELIITKNPIIYDPITIYVNGINEENQARLLIYDRTGTVHTNSIIRENGYHDIPSDNLPAGSYYIQLRMGTQVENAQIIKISK